MADIFDEMVERWGSPAVARTEAGKFSGGLINPRTLANLDSLGCGVVGRFRVKNRIAYPAKCLAQFLRERSREA